MNEKMDAEKKDFNNSSVSKQKRLTTRFFEKIISIKNEGDYKCISVFGKKLTGFDTEKNREKKSRKLAKFFLEPNKTNIYKNIKLIEFIITMQCNYKCEYCIQSNIDKSLSASDEVIDNFLTIIPQIPRGAEIKVIGGEPIIHPRFFEVAENILKNGHTLNISSNFSYPNTYFEKLLDEISDDGNKLIITISLHLSQIKSIDWFIDKVSELKKYGGEKLSIGVVTCLLQENFEIIKKIREQMALKEIPFTIQRLVVKGFRTTYSQEIEEWLKSISATGSQKKSFEMTNLNRNVYGLECNAGYNFLKIYLDGSVERCYETHKNLFNLGNLKDGNIKVLAKPLPCLSQKCTCDLPYIRGLIKMDNKRNMSLAKKIKRI